MSDRGSHFLNDVILQLTSESMLCSILTKMVEASHNDWEHKLIAMLWAYRIAYKAARNHTPFSLAFGMEVVMPMEYLVLSLKVVVRERLTKEALLKRLVKLEKLEETRLRAAMELPQVGTHPFSTLPQGTHIAFQAHSL